MAAEQHSEDLPSEATPLLNNPPVELDGNNVPISLSRGVTIVVTMGLLLFIQTTNMSMMTTAQSDIAADLDAFSETTWFNSAFLIALSSVTPLAGRLSQIFTPRVYILFSCAVSALGLFITAAARNLAVFLLGRALTGCGGGGIMVVTVLLTLDLTSKKRRGLFLGLINVGMTTGISCGAILAGMITPAFGWRVIFWFQAPLSLALGLIQYLATPPSPTDAQPLWGPLVRKLAQVDYGGALALTISVFLLLFSLASPEIQLAPLLLCFVTFAGFLLIESKYTSEPIIPVEVLRMRSVLLTCLSGLASMMARWAVLFFTPVYAMVVRNWSPASAGLILVPTNVGFGLGGLLVGWLHIRQAGSYYISNIIALSTFALTNLILVVISTPSSPTVAYLAATFFNGLSVGALMNYSLSHLLHLTRPDIQYIVSALITMSRGFAGSFGSAIGGGFFQRQLKISLETGFAAHGLPQQDELIRKLLGSPALVKSLTGIERAVAVQGYEQAVKALLLGGCVLALAATAAQAGTGWRPYRDVGKGQDDLEESLDRDS